MTLKPSSSNTGTTATGVPADRRRRVPMAALACAVLTAVAVGTAVPAIAAPAARPAAAADRSDGRLPDLDSQALQRALSSAPDRVTGVLARVSGPDGHWTGT
ncbi:hypothetical protein ACFWW0_07790, partial [Streptomyces violascens]